MNEEKEEKVLKEGWYKQKFLGDYCLIVTDFCLYKAIWTFAASNSAWAKISYSAYRQTVSGKKIYYENSLVRNRGILY